MLNEQTIENPKKERGILLTIWLITMLVANFSTALFYFFGGAYIVGYFPGVPLWIIYFLGFGALFNVALTIFLFKWKK